MGGGGEREKRANVVVQEGEGYSDKIGLVVRLIKGKLKRVGNGGW